MEGEKGGEGGRMPKRVWRDRGERVGEEGWG